MVIAEVECVCSKCQKIFIFKKECHNGLDAEKARRYALKHRDTCPECYAAEQHQLAMDRAVALNLPEIRGRTEKQISFAFSLRDKYITSHEVGIRYAMTQLDKVNPNRIPPAAQKRGLEEEECVEEAFRRVDLHKEFLCLTESDARILIDNFTKRTD